jgi:pimeloyl-ACP methyl ester carboxylesterase
VGRFARGVPQARVVVLPDANHFVFRSNTAEVVAAMRAFIDALPPPDRKAPRHLDPPRDDR